MFDVVPKRASGSHSAIRGARTCAPNRQRLPEPRTDVSLAPERIDVAALEVDGDLPSRAPGRQNFKRRLARQGWDARVYLLG